MRRSALSALIWLGCLHGAHAQEAPFGLSLGPVDTVPKPSMVDREANITALTYFHDRPLAAGIDTDEVILEVCRDEGLQQVIWLSRALSEAELPSRYEAIYQEGVRRYGQPQTEPGSETVSWPSGRALLAVRKAVPGERRLTMLARGDRYESCSAAHQAATGHLASRHASDLILGQTP
ncbi:threonyl-trna synthetase [Methylobacterium nonmethylotrophicum]|uniref:Threonyl-trna synthetase n=1 Tax=Methylobacterium nonmethylotrophicum TaxID=1141884 RepID=A0A4Z0NE19_9HYPH|nr:threonyl-trna synthetase [Methylobacterium nonmethylotrophicum]TGD92015.1 threonyl-trna synthetase [Methylobacterium nonmethylotrophicum]